MLHRVKEVVDNNVTQTFTVHVPDRNKHDHYQQDKSMRAFIDHWVSVVQHGTAKGVYPKRYFLFDHPNASVRDAVQCSSVWVFYDHINWSHQRKKLLSENETC